MRKSCWLCCCGGLPLLGLIKGALNCIPLALTFSVPCFLMSLCLLIPQVVITEYTIVKTKKIGRNVKIVLICLVPGLSLVYIALVLLISFLGGLGYALFVAMKITLDDHKKCNVLWNGLTDPYPDVWNRIVEFWEMNYEECFSLLQNYRTEVLNPEEKPFEITGLQLLIGVCTALVACIVEAVLIFVIASVKFFPCLWRVYYILWNFYWSDGLENYSNDESSHCRCSCSECLLRGICFPIWLLVNLLLLPGSVIVYSVCIAAGSVILGIETACIRYKGSEKEAIHWMLQQAHMVDQRTSEFAFGDASKYNLAALTAALANNTQQSQTAAPAENV